MLNGAENKQKHKEGVAGNFQLNSMFSAKQRKKLKKGADVNGPWGSCNAHFYSCSGFLVMRTTLLRALWDKHIPWTRHLVGIESLRTLDLQHHFFLFMPGIIR